MRSMKRQLAVLVLSLAGSSILMAGNGGQQWGSCTYLPHGSNGYVYWQLQPCSGDNNGCIAAQCNDGYWVYGCHETGLFCDGDCVAAEMCGGPLAQ